MAFPNVFDRIKTVLAPDKIVYITGKMQLDSEKPPVIILDKMQEYNPETGTTVAPAEAVVQREPTLWLNASLLSEEEFADFAELFSHYTPGKMTVKIKRGSKLYKLTEINYCRGLVDELLLYLQENDIKLVK